jgi:hypothetical protein
MYGGHLYQLFSKTQLPVGAYVQINGPYDTYGIVQKSAKHPNGGFLNLIRGTKQKDIPVSAYL